MIPVKCQVHPWMKSYINVVSHPFFAVTEQTFDDVFAINTKGPFFTVQKLAPLLTAYLALPQAQRSALLQQPWQHWAGRVLDDLAGTHPDLPAKVERIDLCRFGHAMSIPVPGLRGSAELAALNAQQGRVVFAHSDLAGYSVFEEAYTAGVLAARRLSL